MEKSFREIVKELSGVNHSRKTRRINERVQEGDSIKDLVEIYYNNFSESVGADNNSAAYIAESVVDDWKSARGMIKEMIDFLKDPNVQ